ncbi:MAG: hypothetical protein ACHP7J_00425 [Terriglobales bacterium]
MPKLPIFRFRSSEPLKCPELRFEACAIPLEGLQRGVDNLRYDVYLSPRVVEDLRAHLARYIRRFGEVDGLLELDLPAAQSNIPRYVGGVASKMRKTGPADLKGLLVSLHLAILNRAKAEENPALDMLGRLAVVKFIRAELQLQFSRILEQCRIRSKSLEGLRQAKMFETRELVATFQARKKIILRKTGQEMFRLLREIEKETLARTRRSLFGGAADGYRLFLNPLIFTEDGRDDYLCAEHYYMFGNFDKDPDRFPNLRRLASEFLQELGGGDEPQIDLALSVPDNATALVGAGNGEDSTPEEREREARLERWTRLLDEEDVLTYVIASYEAAPLLADYAPLVNPQQLKHALLSRAECERVEKIIAESISSERLFAAVGRVASCRGSERSKIAARLLHDLFCYQRDLHGLETLNAGLDSINLIGNDKLRELSIMNGMLYEFLPPEDQKAPEQRALHHVILKADVRDSSRLTRSLMDKGMNAASYFSLNFYEPVKKLLAKYGAEKVFLEGDAIILALLEREGEAMLGVSRACVLAWEILTLMRACNELLERSGLPQMEIGLGIAYLDSAPLYLLDGDRRIMISEAINQSDRLSSCNKRMRRKLAAEAGIFQVYTFQIAGSESADAASSSEDFTINYNVGGICLSEPAFRKLQQEISLTVWPAGFTGQWIDEQREFYVGTVPLANRVFRKVVIRKGRVAHLDVRDFSLQRWTDKFYFEVCANPAVYEALSAERSATASP